jgi:hypothetical protein
MCFSNATGESECQYVGEVLRIKLIETQKANGLNQGIFTFAFQPLMPLLSRYNYASYFHFECNSSTVQVVSWTYADGRVTLVVDYFSDLEAQPALATFGFNQLFIRYDPIIIEFTVQSDGLPLLFYEETVIMIVVRYLFLSAAALALLLLLVGSWCARMVGAEIVTIIQLMFYLQFTIEFYSYPIQTLLELSLTSVSRLFFSKTNFSFLVVRSYQKLPFSLEQAE